MEEPPLVSSDGTFRHARARTYVRVSDLWCGSGRRPMFSTARPLQCIVCDERGHDGTTNRPARYRMEAATHATVERNRNYCYCVTVKWRPPRLLCDGEVVVRAASASFWGAFIGCVLFAEPSWTCPAESVNDGAHWRS